MSESESMPLQRYMARCGVASRRGSEAIILEGRVTVNGKLANEMGIRVNPEVDTVAVDGKEISIPVSHGVIMLNKPAGYLTSMSDPFGRPCVVDLLPLDEYPGLTYIGRLDFDTTGLLLFSNDGELVHRLSHPKYHVDKTYRAKVKGVPDQNALNRLENGVKLEDGMTSPAKARLISSKKGSAVIELTIHEGRKHQVKRMCKAVGHPVQGLHRSSFGKLTLGSLKPGSWRLLTDEEISLLG
ncbi:MAG: pseudouridine synthase [Anaerotardibacter sp.]